MMDRVEKRWYRKNGGNQMKRIVLYILYIVVICILIFGVPIIINELYKENTGYITLWGAKDVLGYYGIILGCLLNALVSIYVVRKTIRNTRSQILYEKEVETEKEKWKKVEQIIDDTLKLLEPSQYILVNIDVSQPEQVYKVSSGLMATIAKMRTSVDWIKAYVRPEEYVWIESLVELILPIIDKETILCNELNQLFLQTERDAIQTQLNKITGGNVDEQEQFEKQQFFLDNTLRIKNTFATLQQNEYQNILNYRRKVFIHIYDEINKSKQFWDKI